MTFDGEPPKDAFHNEVVQLIVRWLSDKGRDHDCQFGFGI